MINQIIRSFQTKKQQAPKVATQTLEALSASWKHFKMFDIAANLSDERFIGEYYGKQCHTADFDQVIQRANSFGVQKFLFAAGYIQDAKTSLELSQRSADFYATVGIHPCRAIEPYKSAGENFDNLDNERR